MTYTTNIVKIEILDDNNDIAATLEVFDAYAAHVKIDCLTNVKDWLALSLAVEKAVMACNLQDSGGGGSNEDCGF